MCGRDARTPTCIFIKGGKWNSGLLATLLLYKTDPPPASPNCQETRGLPNPHPQKGQARGTLLKAQATNAAPKKKKNRPLLPPIFLPSSSPATTCSHGNGLQDGDGGDEHQGGVQAVVHGDEVEEGAPLRGLQDRRAHARRAGGQGGRPRGGLRGARRRAAHGRLPLRRLRLRLRLRRQLPEEQDLLHRMVAGGVEDTGQDSVRDVEARPAAGAGRGPLRGAGHRALRDGLRRHQRARTMSGAAAVSGFYYLGVPVADDRRCTIIGRTLIGAGGLVGWCALPAASLARCDLTRVWALI